MTTAILILSIAVLVQALVIAALVALGLRQLRRQRAKLATLRKRVDALDALREDVTALDNLLTELCERIGLGQEHPTTNGNGAGAMNTVPEPRREYARDRLGGKTT